MSTRKNSNGHDMVPLDSVVPPWVAKMRAAAQAAVSEDDIAAIVRAQVARAKDGDANALRFIFDQVLGGASLKGATFVQNNFAGGERPDEPAKAKAGSAAKLDLMAKRAAAGLPLTHNGDDRRFED